MRKLRREHIVSSAGSDAQMNPREAEQTDADGDSGDDGIGFDDVKEGEGFQDGNHEGDEEAVVGSFYDERALRQVGQLCVIGN